MGSKELEKIRTELSSSDREIRFRACVKLEKVEIPFEEKIKLLIDCFSDTYWSVRNKAHEIILRMPINKTLNYLIEGLKSDNENIAYWCSGSLSNFPVELVVNRLIELFREGNSRVSHWVANSLILMGKDILYLLYPYFNDSNYEVRFWVLKVVSQFSEKSVVPKIIPLLNDARWPIRKLAVSILGELGDFSHQSLLMEAMRDSSWAVRKEAAEALAKIAEREIYEDNFWEVYRSFLEKQVLLESPAFVENIHQNLLSENIYLAASSLKLASKFRFEFVIPYLREKLREDIPDFLQLIVVKSVIFFPDEDFSQELKDLFLKTSSESIKIEILRSLYLLETEWSRELLLTLLPGLDSSLLNSFLNIIKENPPLELKEFLLTIAYGADEFLACIAVSALSRFSDENLYNTFLELLQSPYPLVVKESLLALGRSQQSEFGPFIIPYLTNSNFEIRRAAIIAVRKLEVKEAEEKLLSSLKEYGEEERDIFFILEYLVNVGSDKARDYVLDFFNKVTIPQIKYWIVHFFSYYPKEKVEKVLKDNLFGYSEKMTLEVLNTIYKLGIQLEEKEVVELFNSSNSKIRLLAVKVMTKLKLYQLGGLLVKTYQKEKNLEVKKEIIYFLGESVEEENFDFFISQLDAQEWILRKTAMFALLKFFERGKKDWKKFWQNNSGNFSDNQRFWLLKLAGELKIEGEWFLGILSEVIENKDLLLAWIESVGKIELSKELEEKLFEFLEMRDEKILIATLKSLKNSKNTKLLDKLPELFDNYGGEVKFWIVVLVGNIAREESLELLDYFGKRTRGFLKDYIDKTKQKVVEKIKV